MNTRCFSNDISVFGIIYIFPQNYVKRILLCQRPIDSTVLLAYTIIQKSHKSPPPLTGEGQGGGDHHPPTPALRQGEADASPPVRGCVKIQKSAVILIVMPVLDQVQDDGSGIQ